MSDMPVTPGPGAPAAPPPRRLFSRYVLLGGVLAAGVALGAGGLAAAAIGGGHFGGWHGPRLERIQAFAKRALDGVGATSDQEAKIHDIVASTFGDLVPEPGTRGELRKQAIELLKAPTVDKAAVEKFRADRVAEFDAKSKRFATAVLDIAAVLTPEQRVKLAERAEAWRGKGPGHGWRRPGMTDDGGERARDGWGDSGNETAQ